MKKEDVFEISTIQKKLLSEVRQLPPGPQALEKLALLRGGIDWQIVGYRNIISILSDTIYQDRKHFLLELIQNADDAQFSDKEASLTFIIYSDSIELRYNEHGFTVEDVIAITGAGISTKIDKKRLSHSFIGEKGIGFKSVFALASIVEIESPPWHFILSKDKCIVPKVLYSGKLKNGEGTRLKVKFTDPSIIDAIAAELFRYVSGQVESFLFLQRLASFRVEDLRKKSFDIRGLTLQPFDRSKEELVLTTFPDEEKRKYLLFKEEVEFSAGLVSGRWERLGLEIGPLKRQLIVAALVETTGGSLPQGRLFCFLPTDVTLPLPIFLQIDGHTTANRERLHDPQNNEWNKYLLKILPEFLLRAILAWRRQSEIADKLPVYIPVNEGNDQLANVFKELISLLQSQPWVRTFDSGRNGWVCPGDTVMATDYWTRWFEKYPDFRKKAEKLLGKKFVCPEWVANYEWKSKLSHYGVQEIDEMQITIILIGARLPKEVLEQDDNLIDLYRQIIKMPSLNEPPAHTRAWYHEKSNTGSSNFAEIKSRLKRAPIFPFKGGKFGPLQAGGLYVKVFWLSGKSSRNTGLEWAKNYLIIDNKYTFEPKLDGDASPERRINVEKNKVRNEVVRRLLIKLDVNELSDENILIKLQLPWLLEQGKNENCDYVKQFEVLKAIFDAFRAKRTKGKDDNYLEQLNKISEAFFLSASGVVHRLNEMVLPVVLRFEEIDHLYGKCGLEALGLPVDFFEPPPSKAKQVRLNEGQDKRRKKLRQDWRDFLIQCGIRNGPDFLLSNKKYSNWQDFESSDKYYFDLWQMENNVNYTMYRPVEIITVDLDKGTKNLLDGSRIESKVLAQELYAMWMKQFSKELKFFNPSAYQPEWLNPAAGYFIVRYIYQRKRVSLSKDNYWGGLRRSCIPIETIRGNIADAKTALRIPLSKQSKFITGGKHLSLVLENEKGDTCYHSAYLDSLEIKAPKITDVNPIWQNFEEKNYPEILKVAVELLEAQISGSGLEIYDKEAKRLRPATDFKLGREGAKGVPLIERQYGELGRKLGELLGLPEENEVNSYLGLFENIFAAGFNKIGDYSNDLYRLLKHWQGWDASSQGVIANDLQRDRDKYGFEKLPVVIFNGQGMLDIFREAGLIAIALNIADAEKYGLEQSARELGLILPEETGRLDVNDERPLNEQELAKFDRLLQRYAKSLEVSEKSKLTALLAGVGLGNYELLGKKVFRAVSIARVLGKERLQTLSLTLPYLDRQEQRFYVASNESLEITLARLLSICGFTRFKHAKQDIQEVAREIRDKVSLRESKDRAATGKESVNGKNTGSSVADSSSGVIYGDETTTTVDNDVNSVTETDMDRKFPEMRGERVTDVASAVRYGLTDKRPVPPVGSDEEEWKVGLDPEQERELREKIGSRLVESLMAGPVFYEKKLRKSRFKSGKSNDRDDLKVVDSDASDPKAFLQAEYGGQCQICSIELKLCSGRKWFEVYRIYEPHGVAWWADRPFNILSLCPNCHALAKHGGRDMSSVYNMAREVIQGDFFPVEAIQFKGDFYVVPVSINGRDEELKISKVHMNYFVELFKADDEVAASCEEE